MIIAGNDRDEQTIRGREVADITKIITYHAREYLPLFISPGRQQRYLCLFFFFFFFILFFLCTGNGICCFDYWSAPGLGALRKYQSAPPQR